MDAAAGVVTGTFAGGAVVATAGGEVTGIFATVAAGGGEVGGSGAAAFDVVAAGATLGAGTDAGAGAGVGAGADVVDEVALAVTDVVPDDCTTLAAGAGETLTAVGAAATCVVGAACGAACGAAFPRPFATTVRCARMGAADASRRAGPFDIVIGRIDSRSSVGTFRGIFTIGLTSVR